MKSFWKAAAALLAATSIMSCQNTPVQDPAQAVLDNIATRVSVRHYTDEKLTDAQIETLLRAGMAAPSAVNLQPWQFVVVTDSTVAAQMTTGRVNRMYAEAPCLIVVCGEVTTLAKPHGAPADAEPVERENPNWMIDCSAVCENILLAAHAIGLGGVWTACYPYPERYEAVKAALGIPEKVMPLAVLPIGHPAEQPAPKDKWKVEKIHYGRW